MARVRDPDLLARLHLRWRECVLERDDCLSYLSLHHLHKRPRDDVEGNLVMLCGDGVSGCHGRVEAHDAQVCHALAGYIRIERPDAMAYIRDALGGETARESWMERSLHDFPRPLLLGEAPSRDEGVALGGRIATRLCGLLGLEPRTADRLRDLYECRNLFDAPITAWSTREARERWDSLAPEYEGRVLVLLGRKVETAVLRREGDYYEWGRNGAVVVPHPSGRNRLLNLVAHQILFSETLREAWVRSAAPGTTMRERGGDERT